MMWSNERTAGTRLGWAGIPAVLSLFLLIFLVFPGSSFAEDGKEDDAGLRTKLDIRGALQIEFFAARGSVYSVEAQSGEGAWRVVHGPVFGRDEDVVATLAGVEGAVAYRLKSGGLAGLGQAPLSLEGHAYSLNFGSKVIGLHFATNDGGVASGQDGLRLGFSFFYQKIEPDLARLAIDFSDGAREELELRFWHGRIGIFQGVSTSTSGRERRSSGTFRAGADVDPANAIAPRSLEGSKFVFRDRGMNTVISFTTDFSGFLVQAGGAPEIITYNYDPSAGSSASVDVAFAESSEVQQYAMEFRARNSGGFTRRVIRGGELRDTDRGRFSGKGDEDEDDDGKGGGNTESDCIAPESLRGRTLQATIDGKVVTILLDGAGTGSILKRRENGRVALQPFEYTYSKEGDREGLLTLTLPSGGGEDEVQVFELDFTSRRSGDCVRRRYEDGDLDDTGSGSFTLSADDGAAGDIYNGGGDDE